MTEQTVAILIVALLASVIGPSLLSYLNGRQRHADKMEDYARQDQVAARLKAQQDEVAEKAEVDRRIVALETRRVAEELRETTRVQAVATAEVTEKIDKIGEDLTVVHTLVNSNLTQAMEGELDQTRITLALLRKVMALHSQGGTEASPADLGAVAQAEAKVAQLENLLAVRDRKSTRLNSSHFVPSRMPSSA